MASIHTFPTTCLLLCTLCCLPRQGKHQAPIIITSVGAPGARPTLINGQIGQNRPNFNSWRSPMQTFTWRRVCFGLRLSGDPGNGAVQRCQVRCAFGAYCRFALVMGYIVLIRWRESIHHTHTHPDYSFLLVLPSFPNPQADLGCLTLFFGMVSRPSLPRRPGTSGIYLVLMPPTEAMRKEQDMRACIKIKSNHDPTPSPSPPLVPIWTAN